MTSHPKNWTKLYIWTDSCTILDAKLRVCLKQRTSRPKTKGVQVPTHITTRGLKLKLIWTVGPVRWWTKLITEAKPNCRHTETRRRWRLHFSLTGLLPPMWCPASPWRATTTTTLGSRPSETNWGSSSTSTTSRKMSCTSLLSALKPSQPFIVPLDRIPAAWMTRIGSFWQTTGTT